VNRQFDNAIRLGGGEEHASFACPIVLSFFASVVVETFCCGGAVVMFASWCFCGPVRQASRGIFVTSKLKELWN
jgi:hypothetical protein